MKQREIKFRVWDGSGKYLAGDDGEIYSTDFNHTGETKKLKPTIDNDGYAVMVLNMNGTRIVKSRRKLVALAFHGERPNPKHQINHKNGIRHDDRPDNLEYVTASENCIHGYKVNGRKQSDRQMEVATKSFTGSNNPKAKVNEAVVLSIRRLRQKGASLKSIAERHSISVAQVSAISNNKFWKNGI